MASTRVTFRRDLGLLLRMLLTMALLGLLCVLLVVVLLAAGVGIAMMLVIVAALALAQLFPSDRRPDRPPTSAYGASRVKS